MKTENSIDLTKKVIITCPIHGDFWETPENHLNGVGCPDCDGHKMNKLTNEISSALFDMYDLKKICEIHDVLGATLEDGGLEPTVADLIHDIIYTLELLEHYHK